MSRLDDRTFARSVVVPDVEKGRPMAVALGGVTSTPRGFPFFRFEPSLHWALVFGALFFLFVSTPAFAEEPVPFVGLLDGEKRKEERLEGNPSHPRQNEKQDKKQVETKDARIDLNSASLEELCSLPGIGPKKAEAIIALREKRPLTRVTQLLLVRGIGKKTLEKLRPHVALRAKPKAAAKANDVFSGPPRESAEMVRPGPATATPKHTRSR